MNRGSVMSTMLKVLFFKLIVHKNPLRLICKTRHVDVENETSQTSHVYMQVIDPFTSISIYK